MIRTKVWHVKLQEGVQLRGRTSPSASRVSNVNRRPPLVNGRPRTPITYAPPICGVLGMEKFLLIRDDDTPQPEAYCAVMCAFGHEDLNACYDPTRDRLEWSSVPPELRKLQLSMVWEEILLLCPFSREVSN